MEEFRFSEFKKPLHSVESISMCHPLLFCVIAIVCFHFTLLFLCITSTTIFTTTKISIKNFSNYNLYIIIHLTFSSFCNQTNSQVLFVVVDSDCSFLPHHLCQLDLSYQVYQVYRAHHICRLFLAILADQVLLVHLEDLDVLFSRASQEHLMDLVDPSVVSFQLIDLMVLVLL